MERIGKIKKDGTVSECHFFEVQKQDEQAEKNQTYLEILNIFKEAFSLIDINRLLGK